MLETAMTSSITNSISVFETTSMPDGWIRTTVHANP